MYKIIAQTTSGGLFSDGYQPVEDLETVVSNFSMNAVLFGSLILIVLLIVAALTKERIPKLKMPLFSAIALTVTSVSLAIIGGTIYLNVNSESGGPVHWHADFELWACGQEMELRDPIGRLNNKIGSPSLHEHNDRRVHLEGVLVEERDASLGKFLYVLDGGITDSAIKIPLNSDGPYFDDEDGDYAVDPATRDYITQNYVDPGREGDYATFVDGQTCEDGTIADVQLFAYEVVRDNNGDYVVEDGKNIFIQRKIDDPVNYVINDDSIVPPGDCLIFEFDRTKESTDKLCRQYEVQGTDYTVINEDGEEIESLGNYKYEGVIQ
jgi:hypothetical protein